MCANPEGCFGRKVCESTIEMVLLSEFTVRIVPVWKL